MVYSANIKGDGYQIDKGRGQHLGFINFPSTNFIPVPVPTHTIRHLAETKMFEFIETHNPVFSTLLLLSKLQDVQHTPFALC